VVLNFQFPNGVLFDKTRTTEMKTRSKRFQGDFTEIIGTDFALFFMDIVESSATLICKVNHILIEAVEYIIVFQPFLEINQFIKTYLRKLLPIILKIADFQLDIRVKKLIKSVKNELLKYIKTSKVI
jgi:hypothetical protein